MDIRELCKGYNLSCAPLSELRYRIWFRADRAIHLLVKPGTGYAYGTHGCKSFPHPTLDIDVPVVMVHDGFYGIETDNIHDALQAAVPPRIDPNHYSLAPVARRAYLLQLFEEQGGRCYYCQRKIKLKDDACIDHMIPLARGGLDKFFNMVMSCKTCNVRKGDQTAEEFMVCSKVK